jgi:hypothetical protein
VEGNQRRVKKKGRVGRKEKNFGLVGGGDQRRRKNQRLLRDVQPGVVASSNKIEIYLYTKY